MWCSSQGENIRVVPSYHKLEKLVQIGNRASYGHDTSKPSFQLAGAAGHLLSPDLLLFVPILRPPAATRVQAACCHHCPRAEHPQRCLWGCLPSLEASLTQRPLCHHQSRLLVMRGFWEAGLSGTRCMEGQDAGGRSGRLIQCCCRGGVLPSPRQQSRRIFPSLFLLFLFFMLIVVIFSKTKELSWNLKALGCTERRRAGEQQPAREKDQSMVGHQTHRVTPHPTCPLLPVPQHGIFWKSRHCRASRSGSS